MGDERVGIVERMPETNVIWYPVLEHQEHLDDALGEDDLETIAARDPDRELDVPIHVVEIRGFLDQADQAIPQCSLVGPWREVKVLQVQVVIWPAACGASREKPHELVVSRALAGGQFRHGILFRGHAEETLQAPQFHEHFLPERPESIRLVCIVVFGIILALGSCYFRAWRRRVNNAITMGVELPSQCALQPVELFTHFLAEG